MSVEKAKPRDYLFYAIATFRGDAEVCIRCHPNQVWEKLESKNKAVLRRNNVVLYIPKEDFEKHWKVVEE